MKTVITGKFVEDFLNSQSYVSPLKRDNNDYLISYRLDNGKDIAFDPRTKKKVSIFIGKTSELVKAIDGVSAYSNDKKPTTALKRVSIQLSDLPVKYKVPIRSLNDLKFVIESQRDSTSY